MAGFTHDMTFFQHDVRRKRFNTHRTKAKYLQTWIRGPGINARLSPAESKPSTISSFTTSTPPLPPPSFYISSFSIFYFSSLTPWLFLHHPHNLSSCHHSRNPHNSVYLLLSLLRVFFLSICFLPYLSFFTTLFHSVPRDSKSPGGDGTSGGMVAHGLVKAAEKVLWIA